MVKTDEQCTLYSEISLSIYNNFNMFYNYLYNSLPFQAKKNKNKIIGQINEILVVECYQLIFENWARLGKFLLELSHPNDCH